MRASSKRCTALRSKTGLHGCRSLTSPLTPRPLSCPPAAHLLLQLRQLQEDAELARRRSRGAAEEARQPADLAGRKYEEAEVLRQQYLSVEREALGAQEAAAAAAREAAGPTFERQARLREAAEAEAAARAVEGQVEIVAGKAQRRLYEAEVKAETAYHAADKVSDDRAPWCWCFLNSA